MASALRIEGKTLLSAVCRGEVDMTSGCFSYRKMKILDRQSFMKQVLQKVNEINSKST